MSKRFASIDGELFAEKGQEIMLKFSIYNLKGEKIEVSKNGNVIEQDAKKEITKEQIAEKLGELGDTAFELNSLKIDYDGKSFIPFSELKALKRECVSELQEKLVNSYRKNVEEKKVKTFNGKDKKEPIFSALVSNKEQEKACREAGIEKIYHKQYDVAK